MKTWIIGFSLAALAAGSAYAVESGRPSPDTDGNGILTRAEAEARSARLFARLDANKDGKLDSADRAARQAARFDRIDTDKDGQISRSEFTAPRMRPAMHAEGAPGPRMGPGRRGPHGMMMRPRMADTDGDGAITQAEFTAAMMKRFDRADLNKDGQVTQDERRAIYQLRRQPAAPAAAPAS
jgi:Ca2+-binding EF-hand superfamily protein